MHDKGPEGGFQIVSSGYHPADLWAVGINVDHRKKLHIQSRKGG